MTTQENAPAVRFPDDSQRLVILGRTGSGKTQAGLWHLSMRSFTKRPWIIFDTKGEALIRELDPIEIRITDPIPKHPGLYVVRPLPIVDDDRFDAFMWRMWQREGVGGYFDEGYMIPNSGRHAAFLALLTQGRAKQIPLIVLSQRPVEMSRFVWSEADFFQLFNLNHSDDILTATKFIRGVPRDYLLPSFCSYYFDVGTNKLTPFNPVPGREEIIAAFKERLPKRVQKL